MPPFADTSEMNSKRHIAVSLLFAWVLWERVVDMNSGLERWRNLGAYDDQRVCQLDIQSAVSSGYRHYHFDLHFPLKSMVKGPDGFSVRGELPDGGQINEVHLFQCYPSEFDPHPKKPNEPGI